MKRKLWRAGVAIGLALVMAGLTFIGSSPATSGSQVIRAAGIDFPNCRFGVGVNINSITTYKYTSTRSGWYLDWNVYDNPPAGLQYFRTLRVKQDKNGSTYLPSYRITPTLDFNPGGLGPVVQANLGQVWIIGNEPERVYYQDETLPGMYAQVYHDAYTFIKGIDPTAKIAIGGVIQPTPLRLQYLDMVLAAYRAKYGGPMPIDVWNVHMYILQEVAGSFGASIPVGITATVGMTYTIPQSLDMSVFTSLVNSMRQWMKARGYGDKPLIITEYGVLFPLWLLDDYGLYQTDVNGFLSSAVNYLNTAADPSLGYPADGYRLVQQAALYSLDDDSQVGGYYRWGSFVHNSTPPYTLTASGAHYLSIMASLTSFVDLQPYRIQTAPASLLIAPGETVSPTVHIAVANKGNVATPMTATVRLWDVTGGGQIALLPDRTLPATAGCGTQQSISFTWPHLSSGLHQLRIEVDANNQIVESNEDNNVMTATVLVGNYGGFLPLVQR